jgi:hypothetical protein
MLRTNFAVSKKEIALPLQIAYDFKPSHWIVAVQLLIFVFSIVHINEPKKELMEITPPMQNRHISDQQRLMPMNGRNHPAAENTSRRRR